MGINIHKRNYTIKELAKKCDVNENTFKRYFYKKENIKKIIIKLDKIMRELEDLKNGKR